MELASAVKPAGATSFPEAQGVREAVGPLMINGDRSA
jgi:hypothetical protein